MRNINKYEDDYLKDDFEKYQVVQRRKTVLKSIFGKKKILEIGCGMAPLFSYIDWDFNDYTIFEPGERFMNNAKTLALKEGKK